MSTTSDRVFVTSDGAAHMARAEKACELLRCDAVLDELQACRSNNNKLINWFLDRRNLLASELGGIPARKKRGLRS